MELPLVALQIVQVKVRRVFTVLIYPGKSDLIYYY